MSIYPCTTLYQQSNKCGVNFGCFPWSPIKSTTEPFSHHLLLCEFFFIFSHCLIALSGMLCVNRANSDITCVVHIMIPLTDAKAREVYSTGQNVYVPAPQVCEVRITSWISENSSFLFHTKTKKEGSLSINLYLLGSVVRFVNTYPLGGEVSVRSLIPNFEQLYAG